MRKIVYSVAMSLDGYIAAPDGGYDWIVMDPEIDFKAMFDRFDTFLMGRRTYEVARSQRGGGGKSGPRTVVVSRTLRPEDCPGVTVISENVAAAVAELKAQPGKDIWLFGGGELFRSLLEMRLVDAVGVGVIPVLLGGGVPLLPPPAPRVRLKLIESKQYRTSGMMGLEYACDYDAAPRPGKARVRRGKAK